MTLREDIGMRVVALEEHFCPADLTSRIPADRLQARGWSAGDNRPARAAVQNDLQEAGTARLAGMDKAGISMQILSISDERRVGEECVSTFKFRWWPYN